MRSERVYRAIEGGMSRFEVCRIVSKGVKATHKTGSRFEDSINSVLDCMGTGSQDHVSAGSPTQPENSKNLKSAA